MYFCFSPDSTWHPLRCKQVHVSLSHVPVTHQVLDMSQTPDLESPQYTVLRVTKDYEVRRYEPFTVAEAPMGAGSSE
jgi:hypothetical protein